MVGTTCHYFFESQCTKSLPDHVLELEPVDYASHLNEDTLASIGNINRKIESVMRQHDFEPISLEEGTWSNLIQVAGRVDYMGYLDGKLSIVDLKTSKAFHDETKSKYLSRLDYMEDNDGKVPPSFFSKYALQLSTYRQCFKERRGIDIERLWIMRVNENNKPELRLYPDMLDDVLDVRDMYREEYNM